MVDVEGLAGIPLLANLPESNLGVLSRLAREQKLAARKVIVAENAPFSGLHLIRSGRVKLCKVCNTREQILEILGPGEVIDPVPLFDGGTHALTAKTMTPVVLYRFPPDAAQQLIAEYPPLLNALLNLISVRLRKLADLANALAFKDVHARVCRVLLEQANLGKTPRARRVRLNQPLTRQELASLVGTAREVAWRTLKKLESDGLIEIDGQDIVIVDAEALASLA